MWRALGFIFAALPFAFGAIRAVQTGWRDVRYLWVALAGAAGALVITRLRGLRSGAPLVVAVTAFVLATICAVGCALLLGTRLGPGVMVVGASFGGCFAAAALLNALSR